MWRSSLQSGDEAELLKWIESSGLERVARIVATFADSGGKHGQPEKLELGLLVRIADLLRQQPQRSLHSVAVEVAREAYPGASLLGSEARRGLKDHPATVKPTAMLEDALLDLTNRGDIVIDPFLGSGSTLIAADATGRVGRGVELDPLYVDVIVRRYEAATGKPRFTSRPARRSLR